jgi:glutamyl-tRNA(Gln) amidotransferase subunit D
MPELNFQPGDFVRLRLAKKEVEGVILESADSSIYLLKLKSGYNVGIPKENVLAGRALKKYKPDMKKYEIPGGTARLPDIGLIVTGGTIASKLDPRTGGVAPLTEVEEFARFYPELFNIASPKVIKMPFMIASESMTSEHWIRIAEIAREMLNDKDIEGIIITHGTDFLHYTSAALSFFLRNLNKPVVLTYSQRSIDRGSSDANLNLQCAARMAISDCAEVMLVGHATTNDDFCYALPGTKVRKMRSSRRDAFKAVNAGPIAKVWPDKIEFLRDYNPRTKSEVELDVEFSDKIALVKFYPGQDPDILDYYALKYKGIIVEGSGLGHVPVSEAKHNWAVKLKKHIREGFIVGVTTQCIFGRVDPYVYRNLRELNETGVIFLEDMLPETALVKLGWVLGHHGWKGKAREKMLENVAGELNERLGSEFLQ